MGILKNMLIIDCDGTDFDGEMKEAVKQGTNAIIEYLRGNNLTDIFINDLTVQLSNKLYFRESLSENGFDLIKEISKATADEFKKSEDRKSILNNIDRLFPEKIEDFNIKEVRKIFEEIRRHKHSKMLLSKLELKLRCYYFNKIEPPEAQKMIEEVYKLFPELHMIQFVISNINKIFPENPKEINYDKINKDTLDLKV